MEVVDDNGPDERSKLRMEIDALLKILPSSDAAVVERQSRLDELKKARPVTTRILDNTKRERKLQARLETKRLEEVKLEAEMEVLRKKLQDVQTELTVVDGDLEQVQAEKAALAAEAVQVPGCTGVSEARPAAVDERREADLRWIQARMLELSATSLDPAAQEVVQGAMRQAFSDKLQAEHQKASIAVATNRMSNRMLNPPLPPEQSTVRKWDEIMALASAEQKHELEGLRLQTAAKKQKITQEVAPGE